MLYADWTYYSETYGGEATQDAIAKKLLDASDDIDVLTYSRIVALGWEKLTEFQKACIQKACCVQADFLLENADAIESAMTHYSINGVTMEFGNAALYTVENGTAISNRAYSLLQQTGLTSLIAFHREVDRALS